MLVADRDAATRAGDTRIVEHGGQPRNGRGLKHRIGVHGQ